MIYRIGFVGTHVVDGIPAARMLGSCDIDTNTLENAVAAAWNAYLHQGLQLDDVMALNIEMVLPVTPEMKAAAGSIAFASTLGVVH